MRVDTAKLFIRLLRHLAPGVVCDVGSMNGADAARCARAVPGAKVFAFEPNPYNLAPMLADARLREHGVDDPSTVRSATVRWLARSGLSLNSSHRSASSSARKTQRCCPRFAMSVASRTMAARHSDS